ncbi:hypothetical protein SETIT_6G159100v2 [Setaria italica]|uniref:Uncharacterized protein n=1 Tax=Setaria italica TaxID=4555 RepID=A0A368RLY9_SETIT|nr:hypothetical protein SETIT_6G159100v2 [Setaria italica]
MANWQARPHPSLSIATRQFATRPPHSSHQVPGGTGRSIQPQHVLPSPSVARIVASHASRAPDSEIKNGLVAPRRNSGESSPPTPDVTARGRAACAGGLGLHQRAACAGGDVEGWYREASE